ncbi:MAG: YraN family protein [Ruminococcus sp.]|nr:YraN family protein [Ruminococcus sp.]
MTKTETGRLGEERVCAYLIERGYSVVSRNFRIKGGEIDIIAENGDYIAFVEVKTRRQGSMVSGFEAVNRRKQGLVIRAAAEYLRRNPTMLQPRFDTAQVTVGGGEVTEVDYLENAYDTTGYDFIY